MTELVTIQALSLSPSAHHDLFVHSVPGNQNVAVSGKSADPSFGPQATWKLVPALVDQTNKDLVSIESVARPATYLRHQLGIVSRLGSDDTDLFNNDTSFFLRHGLSDPNGFSFESVIPKYAGNFITVEGNQLKLEKPSAPEAATFLFGPPLFPIVPAVGQLVPDYGTYKTLENTSWTGDVVTTQLGIPTKEAAFAWFLPQKAKDPSINLLFFNPPIQKVTSGRSRDTHLVPFQGANVVFQWD